jgi:hypothetical protein
MRPRSARLVARTLRRSGDRVGAVGNERQEARVLVAGGGIGGLVTEGVRVRARQRDISAMTVAGGKEERTTLAGQVWCARRGRASKSRWRSAGDGDGEEVAGAGRRLGHTGRGRRGGLPRAGRR